MNEAYIASAMLPAGSERMISGVIFDIQRFSIHDGPGIRTNVFMKGCPMSCKWCSNPEGQSFSPELGRYPDRCLGPEVCGRCRFPDGAMRPVEEQAERCPADAVRIFGKKISEDALMEIIQRDQNYYEEGNGGVTFTGGEPLMQAEFVASILKRCREAGINTCVETAMQVPSSSLEKVIPYTDLIIADLKMMDAEEHRKWTGVGNDLILGNLRTAAEKGSLLLRIPMIPGINDSMDNAEKTADFILNELNGRIEGLELLPFMRMGEDKYAALGREYPMRDLEFDKEEFEERLREISDYYEKRGILCSIEGRKRDKE